MGRLIVVINNSHVSSAGNRRSCVMDEVGCAGICHSLVLNTYNEREGHEIAAENSTARRTNCQKVTPSIGQHVITAGCFLVKD